MVFITGVLETDDTSIPLLNILIFKNKVDHNMVTFIC